jgi:HSP20 family protein
MNLMHWNPFYDVTSLQQRMNRLFNSALQEWSGEWESGTNNWVPPADIYETENDVVVTADLPGIDPAKIDIRVENNVLSLRGERQYARELQNENYHRMERSYGTFSRSFTLATSVNVDKIRANYKDGVLSIYLPKAEQAKPKRIHISAASVA